MKLKGFTLFVSLIAVGGVYVILQALVRAASAPGVRIYTVAAQAMAPTLQMEDRVDVRTRTSVRRYDIVLCLWPGSTRPSFWRVIGLPGERVEIKHKRVFVNSRPLHDPYAHFGGASGWKDYPKVRDDFGPLRVPADRYFLLGDNRDDSNDSRFRGTVARDQIYGIVCNVNR
jgi:signal peptidase I